MSGSVSKARIPDTTARDAERFRTACPRIPEERVEWLAAEGRKEALRLAWEVREFDPHQVWGRLNLLGAERPDVLVAAMVQLAAWVPVDVPVSQLESWTAA